VQGVASDRHEGERIIERLSLRSATCLEGYKRHSVRRQDLVLSRHKHIARVDKTDDILPDVNVVYSSSAVTYLSEIGVAKGGSLSDRRQYALPVARRRMLCQRAKF
jgi:hypothetical protein